MDKVLTTSMTLVVLVLSACTSPSSRTTVFQGSPIGEAISEESSSQEGIVEPRTSMDMVRRAMIIADILFEGRKALDDNRLMTPRRNNAYDRFREVLSYDPDNVVANQGLDMIVQRYVQLANAASKIGDFKEAQTMLNRAETVGRLPDLVVDGRSRLEQAQQMDVEYFSLDPDQLSNEDLPILARLGEIARQLYEDEDARFLITARSDAEGRWIYNIMREAIGGYRLRGNIAIGSEPGVQIQYPF